MKLKEEILKEHSKAQAQKIVRWVGASQTRFDELFDLFLKDEYRVIQRAAWPLSDCIIKHPSFINNKTGQLLENLNKENLHPAVKRNTVRIFESITVPHKYHGILVEYCFKYISNPKEATAVQAYAVTIIRKYAKIYPELLNELKMIVKDLKQIPASLKVRIRGLLDQ